MEKNIKIICEALSDKKSHLIKVLKVSDITSVADYFILSSVQNKKQAQAAADEVEERLRSEGIKPIRTEGYREGEWILLDFGDVVVHIFIHEEREHYDIDEFWKDAEAEEYHDERKEAPND